MIMPKKYTSQALIKSSLMPLFLNDDVEEGDDEADLDDLADSSWISACGVGPPYI